MELWRVIYGVIQLCFVTTLLLLFIGIFSQNISVLTVSHHFCLAKAVHSGNYCRHHFGCILILNCLYALFIRILIIFVLFSFGHTRLSFGHEDRTYPMTSGCRERRHRSQYRISSSRASLRFRRISCRTTSSCCRQTTISLKREKWPPQLLF